MDRLAEAFSIALGLITSLDPLVVEITVRTLAVSASATLLAAIALIPLGAAIHFSRFPGKSLLVSIIQALYSVPTVFVGLVVFLFLSRMGPLGSLGLLFTTRAMVIAEFLLIAPTLTGLVISALERMPREATDTAKALGAGTVQAMALALSEARFAILSAVLLAFGRAISEVGAAMMVGGNIAGRTRTLTTAISLGVGKGETAGSIALGIILLTLALAVSLAVHFTGQRSR
jgi:tungstate transport system permease protein